MSKLWLVHFSDDENFLTSPPSFSSLDVKISRPCKILTENGGTLKKTLVVNNDPFLLPYKYCPSESYRQHNALGNCCIYIFFFIVAFMTTIAIFKNHISGRLVFKYIVESEYIEIDELEVFRKIDKAYHLDQPSLPEHRFLMASGEAITQILVNGTNKERRYIINPNEQAFITPHYLYKVNPLLIKYVANKTLCGYKKIFKYNTRKIKKGTSNKAKNIKNTKNYSFVPSTRIALDIDICFQTNSNHALNDVLSEVLGGTIIQHIFLNQKPEKEKKEHDPLGNDNAVLNELCIVPRKSPCESNQKIWDYS